MPDKRIDFRYTGADVTSAQRLRLFKSMQIKIIVVVGLASLLLLGVRALFPQIFSFLENDTWAMMLNLTMVYVVTMFVLVFITPWIDYVFNRFWRLHLEMAFNDTQLKLNAVPAAKSKAKSKSKKGSSGLVVKAEEIHEYLENKRVFVVVYGVKKQYFVVPKSAFGSPDVEERFRNLLGYSKTNQNTQAEKA